MENLLSYIPVFLLGIIYVSENFVVTNDFFTKNNLFSYHKIITIILIVLIIGRIRFHWNFNSGLYEIGCGILLYFIQKRINVILKIKNKLNIYSYQYFRYNSSEQKFVSNIAVSNNNKLVKYVDEIQNDINETSKIDSNIHIIKKLVDFRNYFDDLSKGEKNDYDFQKDGIKMNWKDIFIFF